MRAAQVLSHPENKHLISTRDDGKSAIDIGFPSRGGSPTTLATLGRDPNADIFVEGSDISRIQCSFEVDLDTGIVMFYDRSNGCTSHVFGTKVVPFEFGRARRVVVDDELNNIIGMGGERCDLILFEIKWRPDPSGRANTIKQYGAECGTRIEHARTARTEDAAPTEPPPHRGIRLHTPRSLALKMRYVNKERLGQGSFGEVHKAIDIDSGKLMAVKVLKRPPTFPEQENWREAVILGVNREIKILSSVTHKNIVNYITSQGDFDSGLKIFMGLKEGTLESLIVKGRADMMKVADGALWHMLQALDYIRSMDIIHRDVKPANILYITDRSGQWQFQLGDFGCSDYAPQATTISGTPKFMAPEVFHGRPQSCKPDIWSLFATIVWTLDVNGFRYGCFQTPDDLLGTHVPRIEPMAVGDPDRRACAAQMLVKLYNGKGLTTPREKVPPLSSLV
ncbi:uncharacterized protein Z520_12269 [Fonsecaea multimorphosa CBS 102226]|uniref:mitogen-activated protein kinase n=1 Tax=Fonsecaea multimorphosa CBS 102226 TaxID=1442371 RepID=A0A0D2K6J8_9EURO|nr:uncharacterized protein Z520_12269 [Fonsecaea multimorphosa CBS 102226]KIX91998.1 hypothetical protein Z520_12269 [Fonsecaea multimorphosa CBS 102226]OAL17357.1 hypothetical protein AYO22_11724 [Fonsecaea multimorphosa]